MGQPHRHAELAREARRAADMIVVLVSNQTIALMDAGSTAAAGQARNRITQGKSAIGEDARGARLHQQAVAVAAAAQ